MGASASAYRDRVAFLLEAPAAPDGMGGTLPGAESTVATVWAKVTARRATRSGGREISAAALSFDSYYDITVRGRLDFTPTTAHRVQLPDGRKLTIHTVIPAGDAREEMTITAVAAS